MIIGMERQKAKAVLEAVLFTMGESVEIDRLSEVIEEDKEATKAMLDEMAEEYRKEGRGIELTTLENAVQLCTKGEFYEYLVKIATTPKKFVLTDTLLETLSIIAYKQPITRLEIEKVRGVSCDHAVNRLLEFDLITEVGRLDAPGRPLLFGTTEQFLRSFGVKSLEDLPERAAEMEITSPSVIIVGQVCSLAEKFDWFDKLPLKGRNILVTRPKERAGTLSEKLRALGAEVTEFPCIATVPLDPCPALEEALTNLSRYEWLAFTSPAGVETVWKRLRELGRDARIFGGVKLAAIGSGTARALEDHGLAADLIPEVYDAKHLGEALAKTAKGNILILRAREGSPALTEALGSVPYNDVAVYRTVYENPRSEELRRALEAGELDYVTFTSASTVKGFVSTVGADADFSKIVGLCIGEQTAAEAKKHSIPVRIAEKAAISALLELAASQP